MNWKFSRNSAENDPVTQIIESRRFPTRNELSIQTGYAEDYIFKSFWLMYSTTYGMLNYSDRHAPGHYMDSATTANARRDESGFSLKPKEVAQEMQHDIPEDVAKYILARNQPQFRPAAGYVLIDLFHKLLATELDADIQRMLELRSNLDGMIFDPVGKYFIEMAKKNPGEDLIVGRGDLADKLRADYGGNYSIPQSVVNQFYDTLISRWKYVIDVIESDKHRYLPQEEKKYATATINDNIKRAEKIRPAAHAQITKMENSVKKELEHIVSLILDGELEEVDPLLVLPYQPKLVLQVNKTLYDMYIDRLMKSVIVAAQAYLAGLPNGSRAHLNDDYLYPGVGKFPDARDTTIQMGPKMENIINQFRKRRKILTAGSTTARILRDINLPYDRWLGGENFLYSGFDDAVNRLERQYRYTAGKQTQLRQDYQRLLHMRKLMEDFKPTQGLSPKTSIGKKISSLTNMISL